MMNDQHDTTSGKFGSKYQPEFPEQAAKLCARFGATDDDLADFFEVGLRTIGRWRAQHEAFADALKIGKGEADDRVERSLYMRATGFRVPAVRHFQAGGVILAEEYEEFIPPDTRACIFWLCNRRGDQWNNQHMRGIGSSDDATPAGPIRVEIVDGRADPDPAAG